MQEKIAACGENCITHGKNTACFPIKGALMQRRGGTVRPDAVSWGYARGADIRGVDLIQNFDATGMRIAQGRIRGVETSRGFIWAKKVGVAGFSSKMIWQSDTTRGAMTGRYDGVL